MLAVQESMVGQMTSTMGSTSGTERDWDTGRAQDLSFGTVLLLSGVLLDHNGDQDSLESMEIEVLSFVLQK
jgi:hypothetical protein